jgi:hypothetical protein
MAISETLLEIRDYQGDGYQPVIDFGAWRVAILRYHDELLPEHITTMQKHDETDEVFVLLEGRCILFLGAGRERVEAIAAQEMEPLKLYNVKRSAWHTHTLAPDTTVLIVENRDTTLDNSPVIELDASQCATITRLTRGLWE